MQVVEVGLEFGIGGGLRASSLQRLDLVEHQRRGPELVEHEDQHADQQYQELQRDLQECRHHERRPAFIDRARSEVALHLALVAAEIGQEQEQRGEQAGPDRVALFEIETEVERLQLAGGAGQVQRVTEGHALGQAGQDHHDADRKPREDDEHLLHVGPRHRLHAAQHRVDGGRQADYEDRRDFVPAEDDREDHRRRGDDDADGEPPRYEEEETRQRAGPRVEALLEILVCREDFRTIEERHGRYAQDDHRERQAEIELDEAHAVGVGLPGRAD